MGIASWPSRSKVPAYHLTPFGGGELKSLLSRFVQLLEGHAAIQGRDEVRKPNNVPSSSSGMAFPVEGTPVPRTSHCFSQSD